MSARRRSRAARSAGGSRGGTSSPVRSSSTRFTRPPTALATTGFPLAIASAQTIPKPSLREGQTTIAACAYRRSSSSRDMKPCACGQEPAEGAVPGDDQVQPVRGRGEVLDALLGRETPCVEDLGGLRLLPDLRGHVDAVGDEHRPLHAGAERRLGQRLRHADDRPRAVEHEPGRAGGLPQELEVVERAARDRAMQRDDERLAGEQRDRPARQPVRVDEVGVPGGQPAASAPSTRA